MLRRPEYNRCARGRLIPWVHSADTLSNVTFGPSPPTSDIGDLILVLAGAHSTDIVPTLVPGYTAIDSDTAAGLATVAALLCYKVATVPDERVGTSSPNVFTNAGKLSAVVFKGWAPEDDGSINGATLLSYAPGVFTYPGLTFTGERTIILGHMADDAEAPHPFPAGFTLIPGATRTSPEISMAMSDAPRTSWTQTTMAQVGNNPAITFAVALRGALGPFR